MTAFRFRPMSRADADAMALWHYPEPFSFYDPAADAGDLAELLDPALRGDRYVAVEDELGELVGYFSFTSKSPETLEIGLGLHPDKTGLGLGQGFVQAGLDYARARFHPEEFVLSVASFNRRAISVYERAGFRFVRVCVHSTNGGLWEFFEMQRPA